MGPYIRRVQHSYTLIYRMHMIGSHEILQMDSFTITEKLQVLFYLKKNEKKAKYRLWAAVSSMAGITDKHQLL